MGTKRNQIARQPATVGMVNVALHNQRIAIAEDSARSMAAFMAHWQATELEPRLRRLEMPWWQKFWAMITHPFRKEQTTDIDERATSDEPHEDGGRDADSELGELLAEDEGGDSRPSLLLD